MNKNAFLVCAAFLLISILSAAFIACGPLSPYANNGDDAWHAPRPVTIEAHGSKNATNFSLMAWSAESEGDDPTVLLLRDKDVLIVTGSGNGEVWIPYRAGDGDVLTVVTDSHGFLLGGKRVALDLSPDSTGLTWAADADPNALTDLRMCALEGPLEDWPSTVLNVLKKLSQIKPALGWMVQGTDVLHKILDLFDPERLLITSDTRLHEDDWDRISREPNLEYLWFSAKDLKLKKSLSCPPKLHTMVIMDWDPTSTGPFPGGWESLRSITLFGSAMKDLSSVASLKKLHELHLVSCCDLTDISRLADFHSLRALSFTGSEKLFDLSVLKRLPSLKWIGLPPQTTQAGFEEMITAQQNLQVLELVECKHIEDLYSLHSLGRLESLVLVNGGRDLTPLHQMKGLRLAALPEAAFENQADMQALQKALPDCRFVRAQPFCLGSGWILLLWPAVLAGWLLGIHRKNRNPQPVSHPA